MSRRIAGRSVKRAGAIALLLLAISTRPAEAHGGPIVFAGDAGPYRVEAYRTWGTVGEARSFAYLLHVRDRVTGARIDDARVTVSARRDAQVTPPREAERLPEEYRVEFIVADDQGWAVEVQIDGPPGRAVTTHPIPPPTSPFEFAATFGIPVLVIAMGWIVLRLRRARGPQAIGRVELSEHT